MSTIKTILKVFILLGLTALIGYADIAIYSVKGFKTITPVEGDTIQILGYVVDIRECPPCSEDADCALCPEEYIVISDLPKLEKPNAITESELKIHTENASTDGIKKWTQYLFATQYSQWGFMTNEREILMLTDFRNYADIPKDNVSIDVKEIFCTEINDFSGCKPWLMKAIETGDFALVKKIVQSGEEMNLKYPYYYGITAFMHAVDKGKEDIALYLLDNGADPNITMPLNPLEIAETHGLDKVVKAIRAWKSK